LALLGDYIDRGRQSAQVIAQLLTLRGDARFETRLMLGNHEDAMLDFLAGRSLGRGWARFGGRATMEAYGVEAPQCDDDDDVWRRTRAQLAAAVPESHKALLRGMDLYGTCGEVLFVHAGVRPGIPLAEQVRDDLLGIRGDFLGDDRPMARFVVHGHTPVDRAERHARRLNLDTGAYLSGRLSGARFDGGEPVIFCATAAGVRQDVAVL